MFLVFFCLFVFLDKFSHHRRVNAGKLTRDNETLNHLSFSLLLHFQFFTQNRRNFTLHKCPWNRWIRQWTFFTTRTIHLRTGALNRRIIFFYKTIPGKQNKKKLTCRLMLSLLHGKQNLWWFTDGHCTKCVSSNRSWHNVHFNVGFGAGVGPAAPVVGAIPSGGGPFPILTAIPGWDCCASVDVTVVLDTCREPDERRPLDEPGKW